VADAPALDQDAFVGAVKAFTDRVLPGEEPPRAVVTPLNDAGMGVLAVWNAEAGRYEVDPGASGRPDMPGYVALMGRFMMRHYHCVAGDNTSDELVELWNNFRMPIVDYLLDTDPEVDYAVDPRAEWPLYRALVGAEETPGASREGVRKVALALLDRFDCDWTMATLADRFSDANRDLGAGLPDEALQVIADATAQRTV
jgi:hypothetical protein